MREDCSSMSIRGMRGLVASVSSMNLRKRMVCTGQKAISVYFSWHRTVSTKDLGSCQQALLLQRWSGPESHEELCGCFVEGFEKKSLSNRLVQWKLALLLNPMWWSLTSTRKKLWKSCGMCLTASVECVSILSCVECIEEGRDRFQELVGGVSQAVKDKGVRVIPTQSQT